MNVESNKIAIHTIYCTEMTELFCCIYIIAFFAFSRYSSLSGAFVKSTYETQITAFRQSVCPDTSF